MKIKKIYTYIDAFGAIYRHGIYFYHTPTATEREIKNERCGKGQMAVPYSNIVQYHNLGKEGDLYHPIHFNLFT